MENEFNRFDHTSENNTQSSSKWPEPSANQKNYYDDNHYDDDNRYQNDDENPRYDNPRYQSGSTSYHDQTNKNHSNEPKKGHNLAIASLVLGIISIIMIFTCCLSYFCIFPAIAGIVCAILAKDESGKRESIATAGFICSVISCVVFVIVVVFTVFIGTHYTDFYEDDKGIEYNIPFNNDDTDAL